MFALVSPRRSSVRLYRWLTYSCSGYNDQGEMLPMQGGTNSLIFSKMCDTLNKEGKRKYLKACWYIAKDRDRPIDASVKERNCHSTSFSHSLSLDLHSKTWT